MFTGMVEQVGRVTSAQDVNGLLSVSIAPDRMWTDLEQGESIAVGGACLTVVGWDEGSFAAQLSQETLAKTAPRWTPGSLVNLERAMSANARFGGHVVSGHVDGVGEVLSLVREPGAYTALVRAPRFLAKYLVPKGSITVDGVSLTLVDVGGPAGSRSDLAPDEFTLWLVPHTLQVTSLRHWEAGTQVNLEADQLAKYVERLILMRDFASQPEVSA